MPQQKGGRTKSEARSLSFKINKDSDRMLKEIQEFTGTATDAETIRLIIFDFYQRMKEKTCL